MDLGDSQTQAIFTVYVVGILATLFIAGPLSDRFGRKSMCLPFVVLSALSSLILILGRDDFLLLLLGRLFLGVVSGAVIGVGSAWMAELVGQGNELKAAVLTTSVLYFGFGAGPLVSAIMEAAFPNPLVWPFVVHAAFTALVLPVLATLPETRVGDRRDPVRIQFGVPPAARSNFLRIIFPAGIWIFGFPSTSFALFPVLLRDAMGGLDVAAAGAAGALTAWGGLMSRPLLRRISISRALPLALALGTVGYVFGAVSFATDWWPLLLPAAILLGFGSGTIAGACLALIGQMADPDKRGALTSTFWLLAYLGMAMPVFITATAGVVGSTTAVIIGITVVAGLVTLWVTQALASLGSWTNVSPS